MNINKESANLIVRIYKQNNTLKNLLKSQSLLELSELIKSGDNISLHLDNSFKGDDPVLFLNNLSNTITFIKQIENGIDIPTQKAIAKSLSEIRVDLEVLKKDIISQNGDHV